MWPANKTLVLCPACRQKLRVPVNLGKLVVKCTACFYRWDWDPLPQQRRRRRLLLGTLIGVVGLLMAFGLYRHYRQENLAAKTPPADGNAATGLHGNLLDQSDELRALRDDQDFKSAEEQAAKERTPKYLRLYLADPVHKRHRADAQLLIDALYSEAIQRLDIHRIGAERKADTKLVEALIALLDSVKRLNPPVVTVAFRGSQDPTPTTPYHRQMETVAHDEFVRRYPELQILADQSVAKTAILPLGNTFDPGNILLQEKVILDRLTSSVTTMLGKDWIAFRAADTGSKAHIEVAYHAFSRGQLYLYTQSLVGPGLPVVPVPNGKGLDMPGPVQGTIKGLLRGYDLKWTITVRPAGVDQVFVIDLEAQPLIQLNYDARPGDPPWAPYAVILYSGFHDMSNRLIVSFGADAPPTPNQFTFAGVAGNKQ
jgi:hypothetical protein